MITGFCILAICLGSLFVIIVVHECGHYMAGCLVGIPFADMRIRLFTCPPHVALREDDESWVSPKDYRHYVALSRRYLETCFEAVIYVSSGLLTQTAFFSLIIGLLVQSGASKLFLIPITWTVFSSVLVYLGIDCLQTRRRGSRREISPPYGQSPLLPPSL